MNRRRVWLDLETTGVDPEKDRIVEIALVEEPTGQRWDSLVNPGVPIPPSATEVHGITDEDVRDASAFSDVADMVQATVTERTSDAGPPIIGTFNGRRFDVPLLDAELRRAGQPGFPRDEIGRLVLPEFDLYRLWVNVERRNLEAALARFAAIEPDESHRAAADTENLPAVLAGMIREFEIDAEDDDALVELCAPEDEIDRAGKFRKDGKRVVFNFGKHRDEDVRAHLGYIEWMLEPGRDFPEETQRVGRWLLKRYRKGE